jgi:hypothetical protein
MADVYFRNVKWAGGEYWQLYGLRNVEPEKREGLNILCQEYLAMSGDIGEPERAGKGMAELRASMEKDGHTLHYEPQASAKKVAEQLMEAEPDYGAMEKKLGEIQGQARQSGDLMRRLGPALQRTHPEAQHPEIHRKYRELVGQREQADVLLAKARYAAAYRSALHKVGLKPTDVVARFGGHSQQIKLGNQRTGQYITAVETKDGRRVNLNPPVEVPWWPKPSRPKVAEAQDPDDPETLAARYLKAMVSEKDAADAAKAAEILNTFKRQAIGYIKWAHAGDEQGKDYDPADLQKIRRAKTFEEAAAVLAQYDTEPSFLSMVIEGYF